MPALDIVCVCACVHVYMCICMCMCMCVCVCVCVCAYLHLFAYAQTLPSYCIQMSNRHQHSRNYKKEIQHLQKYVAKLL